MFKTLFSTLQLNYTWKNIRKVVRLNDFLHSKPSKSKELFFFKPEHIFRTLPGWFGISSPPSQQPALGAPVQSTHGRVRPTGQPLPSHTEPATSTLGSDRGYTHTDITVTVAQTGRDAVSAQSPVPDHPGLRTSSQGRGHGCQTTSVRLSFP